MSKKEEYSRQKHIGYTLVVFGLLILVASLVPFKGITGFAVHTQGSINSENVDALVGDQIVYNGVSYMIVYSIPDPDCVADLSGDDLTITVLQVGDGQCVTIVTLDYVTYYTITLNIVSKTSDFAFIGDEVTDNDAGVTILAQAPSADTTSDFV